MRRVFVNGSLARWLWLVLMLGVVVAALGPAHSVEVAGFEHGAESVAHSHSVGSSADATEGERESHGVIGASGREPGGRDGPRCGHGDVEREATQATVVRVAPPSVVNGPAVMTPGDGEPGPEVAGLDGSRAPPGQRLLVVCVWRQ